MYSVLITQKARINTCSVDKDQLIWKITPIQKAFTNALRSKRSIVQKSICVEISKFYAA